METKYIYMGNWTPGYDEENNAGIFVFRYNEQIDEWIEIEFIKTGYSISWLKIDKEMQLLYVCLETKKYLNDEAGGRILWYRIDKETGKLNFINMCNSLGAYPIEMRWTQGFCLVLNHGSNLSRNCDTYKDTDGKIRVRYRTDAANLMLFSRDEEGNLQEAQDFYPFEGRGTLPFFQEAASPHSLYYGAKDSTYFVPERGNDRVSSFEIDIQQMKIRKKGEILAPKEYGPRNVTCSASGEYCYLITEVQPKVLCYKHCEDNKYELIQERYTVEEEVMVKCQEPKTSFSFPHPVDIAISENGKFIYTLTRTANTLGIFNLNQSTGEILKEQFIVLDGVNPRQIQMIDNVIYIVFHDSAKVQRLVLDDKTGNIICEKDIITGVDRAAVMELYDPESKQ